MLTIKHATRREGTRQIYLSVVGDARTWRLSCELESFWVEVCVLRITRYMVETYSGHLEAAVGHSNKIDISITGHFL